MILSNKIKAIVFDVSGVLLVDNKLDKRLLTIIKDLKQKGYLLFLATHLSKESAEEFWIKYELENIFGAYFTPDNMLGLSKSSIQFFKKIRKVIKIKLENILMIDDIRSNVDTAIVAGWQGYHYMEFEKAEKELFKRLLY